MLRKLRPRSLQADDSGAIIITAIVIIVGIVAVIWLIGTIAGAIIPLAIFMTLAIVLIVIVKKLLFGGESLGIISGLTGLGREAGRETVGLMKGAGREYEHYKKHRGGR